MSLAATTSPTYVGTDVEFRGVQRRFGSTTALAGLDLRIAPGELLALLGPSGCGKTTALRLLAGFDAPDAGQVVLDGVDVSARPAHKRDMGMVFQSYSLFPTMSALDNVAFGLRVRRRPAAERRSRAAELLALVGLEGHEAKYPHQLSGGQQQRVALARALAVEPRVLLLDEPLSALDAKVRETLRDEIQRLQRRLGVTTVFVTHDQEEALSMADRVAVMRAGRLEQVAPPRELYERPATGFVAEFVGTTNRVPGIALDDARVRIGEQVLAVDGPVPSPGTAVTALVRPEAVVVRPDSSGDGVVVAVTFRGAMLRVRVLQGDGTELLADLLPHKASGIVPGARVDASVLCRPVVLA
jgi:putative spermidine/putrescine transport system ATP-binding protein